MAVTETQNARSDGAGANVGRIEEIQGVVIEAVFPDELPQIFSAITVKRPDTDESRASAEDTGTASDVIVLEVQQHLGDDRVRAVAMDSTDGLARGMEVTDTGSPITVPVGNVTLGRIFNPPGEPIDNAGEVKVEERWPIHRDAPAVTDLTPTAEMFETG